MDETSVFDLDLDSVEQLKDLSSIKAGPQTLTITGAEGDVSPKKGTPYIRVQHEYANVEGLVVVKEGMKPRTFIKRDFYLSQKSLPFLRQFVEAMGTSWEEFKPVLQAVVTPLQSQDIEGFKQQVQDVFVGAVKDRTLEAMINLTKADDNGNQYNEIGKYIITQPTS